MKNLIFIIYILIVLFQTGNVLSNSSIFNVNNVEIGKETYKNKENLVNQAFIKSYDQLISRLLLEGDYKILSNTNLKEIKKLISYNQIINPEIEKKEDNIRVNVFFDKDRLHNFFYKKNILYADIVNTEVIFFPLLKKNNQHFIYTKNYCFFKIMVKSSNRSTFPGSNFQYIDLFVFKIIEISFIKF